MKRVKIFWGIESDSEINEWITDMEESAKVNTDGNIAFELHDVKLVSYNKEGSDMSHAIITYSHNS